MGFVPACQLFCEFWGFVEPCLRSAIPLAKAGPAKTRLLVQTLVNINSLNHRRRLEFFLHEMSTGPSRLKCLLNSILNLCASALPSRIGALARSTYFFTSTFRTSGRRNVPKFHDRQCLVSKRENDSFKKLFPKQPPWRYVPREILVPCHKGMACRTRLLSPERIYIIRKCPRNSSRSWMRRPAF